MAQTEQLNQNALDQEESPTTLRAVSGLDKPDQQKPPDSSGGLDKKLLHHTELTALEKNQTTMDKLVSQHKQAETNAKSEVKGLTAGGKFTFNELRGMQLKIEQTKSPKEMTDYVKELQKMAGEKEKDQAKTDKVRSPEDKELMDLQKEFDEFCDKDETKNALENQDTQKWKDWFAKERQKTPTITHLKEQIRKNKENVGEDTIAKRVAQYRELKDKFKKYGLDEPIKNNYILKNGFDQRDAFLKGIKTAETHFRLRKDTGFYSTEILKKMMQENLMADSNEKLNANLLQAENIATKETVALNEHFKKTIKVEDSTIPAMSEASKTELLNFYKNASFKEREEVDFESLVKNEGKLATDLKDVYTDEKSKICDKEGLKKALGSFEKLDFLQKQSFIEEHKRLVKGEMTKEESECLEIKGKALVEINKSFTDKNISDITRQKYSALFNNPAKFPNPKTGKPGDPEAMKKAYDALTSPTAHNERENRNLKAYEVQRNLFQADLKKLQKLNPTMTEEDVRKWQERYDKGRWEERQHIQKTEMPSELFKQGEEDKKRKALDKKAGIKEGTDSKDSKEKVVPIEFARMKKAVYEHMGNGQGREALKELVKYSENDPENPKLPGLLNVINAHIASEGFGGKAANTDQEQLEDKMEDLMDNNTTIKKDMKEQQVDALNTEGAILSMDRHQRKVDASERAEEASMSKAQSGGSLEKELTEDFYKQEKEQHGQKGGKEKVILGKDKTGEKTNVVEFKTNNVRKTEEAIQKQRQEIYHKQTDLDTKKGFDDVELKNEQGQDLSPEAAKQALKQKEEKRAQELADKAQEELAKTKTDKAPGAQFYDIADKVAARHKAEELIANRSHEKIRNAA